MEDGIRGEYKTGKTGTRCVLLSYLVFVDPGISVIIGLVITNQSVIDE